MKNCSNRRRLLCLGGTFLLVMVTSSGSHSEAAPTSPRLRKQKRRNAVEVDGTEEGFHQATVVQHRGIGHAFQEGPRRPPPGPNSDAFSGRSYTYYYEYPYGNNHGGYYGSPYGDPYGNPYANPYGNTYGNPYGNTYGNTNGNPYGNPYGNSGYYGDSTISPSGDTTNGSSGDEDGYGTGNNGNDGADNIYGDSESETSGPILGVTEEPTMSPTIVTELPTMNPTIVTEEPTTNPTIVTEEPTMNPTIVTEDPTMTPTILTEGPTFSPIIVTPDPTVGVTPDPTITLEIEEPTSGPTGEENSAVLTYQNVAGICGGPLNGIGCANEDPEDPPAGNPNDIVNCYDTAMFGVSVPFSLTAVRVWIGDSTVLTPDLQVNVWAGDDGSGGPVENRLLYSEEQFGYTFGENTFELNMGRMIFQRNFCVGVTARSTNAGLRIMFDEGGFGESSFLRSPECGIENFISLFEAGLENDFCIEALVSFPSTF